ncbi:SMC family ATPase [Cryobacterium glaciale]|uniref:Nuclease SbcCD subunit C n=1 Tax=Cryobacterium glaciale TaxID=1259145 RepID=A0A4R8UUS9_9MICO|nr:SMC family ATPase [Cryobacterium glaciale]TFB71347.1 SMC family ATPase [Cryobacterium glaciale]
MKIKRLRLAGFGPFKNEQIVNFERFDSDGIFLITGKTGAGKSSILDAICFALYDQVPRFTDTEQRLRSDYCEPDDPTFVELDFSLRGRDYRLLRSPKYERAKKNGTGTTSAAPTAVLQLRQGGEWRGIAAKPREVGLELSTILPLKADQFLQVILLAQNRFQYFLLAKTEERRAVLRTLFGTTRFEQLESALITRRKSLDESLAAVQRDVAEHATAAMHQLRLSALPVEPDLDWFRDSLAGLNRAVDVAAHDAETAAATLEKATVQHRAATETQRLQARRAIAETTLAMLDARSGEVEEQRGTLRQAARAARVWPHIRSSRAATLAWQAALTDETSARAAWLPFDLPLSVNGVGVNGANVNGAHVNGAHANGANANGANANGAGMSGVDASGGSEPALRPIMDALVGRLGALAEVLAEEKQLPALDHEITALFDLLAVHTDDLTRAQQRLDELPQQIDFVGVQLVAASLTAAGEADADEAVRRADAGLAAAEDVVAVRSELVGAHEHLLDRSRDNAAAAVDYEALVARRISGQASELASYLVDGDACAVCGSIEHPAPAATQGGLVTAADLSTARQHLQGRQQQLADAQETATALTNRLAQAEALAGQRSVSDLRAECAAAGARLSTAHTAADLIGGLRQEQTDLRHGLTLAQAAVLAVRASRDTAADTHSVRSGQRDLLAARVGAQRGECDSVTDQVRALQHELDCARALDGALTLSRQRAAANNAATLQLTGQLREEGFDDEETALAAQRGEGETTRLETVVRSFDDERAAARAAAADPELADLSPEPVDLEPSLRAFEAAGSTRDAAVSTHGSLGERAGQLAELVREVTTRFAESADLLAVHSQVRQLADVMQGDEPNTKRMRLETYVLAAQLEEIVVAANLRLRTMTSGRYALEHDDSRVKGGARSGLGLMIRDGFTGRARATHSLSGGETFLASLALALGLAEVVSAQAGGITLDTLFVDEGFGSLDSETLETAMSTLDTLRAGGRTIGLISHVDSMKEQIPATLRIWVTDQGYSRIEADTTVD